MSWLDRTLKAIAPGFALRRQRDNMMLSIMEDYAKKNGRRGFEAASTGRRTDGWQTTYQLPWQEASRSLPKLRERAIDLANNNPWAKKAVEVIANNTVGTGIVPVISETGLSAFWNSWAGTTRCDLQGRSTFYGLQWKVMHTVAKTGECLIIRRFNRKKGLQLQLLEGFYLDQGRNLAGLTANDNYIVDGVEFNPYGERVAYYIYKSNPLHFNTISERVTADNVIHIYEENRQGQVRGVPFGVSGMLRLRDFDEYEDAQLVRQKIAACYAVFVRDSVDASGGVLNANSSLPESLEPGLVHKLAPGMDISFASPPAAEGYSDYSRNILLAVAAAYGVPYEALTGDLSNVNFSSGRMGWLEFQRNVSRWQQQLIVAIMCHSVWEWFSDYASLMGYQDYTVQRWTPPKREMIDPGKEVSAMVDAVRGGLMSWGEAVRANGYDPDGLIEEVAQYNDKMDAKGVAFISDARKFPVKTGPASDPSAADGGEGDTSNQTNKKKKPVAVKRPQGGGTQPSQ